MDTAKAAIAHANDHIARLGCLQHLGDQAVDVPCSLRACAHRGQRLRSVPVQAGGVAKGQIGRFQRPGQLRLHRAELHRVAARLEHRKNAGLRTHLLAQAIQGGADGRRVVGEIIIDLDAGGTAAQFHAPLDILKARQGLGCLCGRHAHMLGGCHGGERIHLVVHTAQAPLHLAGGRIFVEHFKVRRVTLGAHIVDGRAKTHDLAPAALVQHAGQALLDAIGHHPAAGGHGAYQVVELALNGSQVIKDVGVVELQVVQHGRAGAVMHKLAALVEKCGVVLVGLDHKHGARVAIAGPGGRTQACGDAKIQWHAADQKAWLQAGSLQNPGEHRGCRGLAMGAGHGQHMAALQHMLGQPLGAAGVRGAGIQNGFHQRKLGRAIIQAGPADHIAHHIHVRLQCELVGAKAFDQLNAQRAQLVAHRRVDAAVAARYLVPGLTGQGGHATHEGATNTQNMNVHGDRFYGAPRQNPR